MKSWLVMFGFQLSNIIPGFPRHSLYFVEPPYELQATQHCENGQVGDRAFINCMDVHGVTHYFGKGSDN